MSPLFEHSEAALSFVLIIGGTTAFFMGVLGVVNNDIKRVVAYSTLSQLGYMTVALGASAYSAAIFHLMTHAFFKALLFLAAGSVIIGMHHEQDMRKMGGLAKYMPITAITSWIGTLALVGTPFFSGFYSKDAIIEAVGESHRWGATYAYYCVLLGVFVTSLYSFRLLFMTFHGPERFRHAHGHGHASEAEAVADSNVSSAHGTAAHADAHGVAAAAHGHGEAHGALSSASHGHAAHGASGAAHGGHGDAHHGEPHESPSVVTVPLIALAIPSIIIGFITIGPLLFGGFFGQAIQVHDHNDVIKEIGEHNWHGAVQFALHGATQLPFLLMLAGLATAWVFFYWKPSLANSVARTFNWLRTILVNKYYFDWINENIIAAASRLLGRSLWRGGDMALIDGGLVNGTAASMGWFGSVMRHVQSGYLYSYAFWMIIGLAVLLGYFLWRAFGF
jgi:NADH-quinone oxidoreductase subunit L